MAYTYTAVTTPRVVKRVPGSPGLGLFSGKVTISVYDATHAEITEITSKFKSKVVNVVVSPVSTNGYLCAWDPASNSIKCFVPGGAVAAPTFTGATPPADLNLATPVFSGTGLTAAGQVITTTDNQTMTLNQCAGMWLMAATANAPSLLIISNTAVSGAPAVLTVKGVAATDAGAYKIVTGATPTGSNSAPALTGGASAEAGNGVNIGDVQFIAMGVTGL